MGERAIEPGRYAQHPDGSWVPFKDKAALLFKPVACVTVRPRTPLLACSPDLPPVAVTDSAALTLDRVDDALSYVGYAKTVFERATMGPIGGDMAASGKFDTHVAVDAGVQSTAVIVRDDKILDEGPGLSPVQFAKAVTKKRRAVKPAPPPPTPNRIATPADVFRAVADQFGILPATGNNRSCARFKPLVRRDEEAEAARAFERGVEERQAKR